MSIVLRALEREDLPAARVLLRAACAHDNAAAVADEKIFGPAPAGAATERFGAFDRAGELYGVAVASGAWIRLLAVAPDARGRGIGTLLLAAAESAVAASGAAAARTMDQPGNYLAPGVAIENTDTIEWLERRGYARVAENVNLTVDLASNPRVSAARVAELADRAAERGYHVRRARAADRARLLASVQLAFGRGWAFEIDRALECDPPAVHLAVTRDGDDIAAFAAHDGNNRGLGWFGPAGTHEAHRGRGLGEALLLACLCDVAGAGLDRCTIAWIGPRAFYEKTVGVAGDRRFVVLSRALERAPSAKETS